MPKLTKRQEKLKAEFLERMHEHVKDTDYEVAHSRADDLLCDLLKELGFKEVVDVYDKVGKWYA